MIYISKENEKLESEIAFLSKKLEFSTNQTNEKMGMEECQSQDGSPIAGKEWYAKENLKGFLL